MDDTMRPTAFLVLLVYLTSAHVSAAPPAKAKLQTVRDFALKDHTGKLISLSQFKDKQAVILIFMGTQCPINNAYVPRLAQIVNDYGKKGVQLIGINSNSQDLPEDIAEHVQKF